MTRTPAISLLWVALVVGSAQGQENQAEAAIFDFSEWKVDGANFYLEEDLFLFNALNLDRNYTGGASIQLLGPGPDRVTEALIQPLDALWMSVLADDPQEWPFPIGSVTLALAAFTPDSLAAVEPIHDDRPYSSLLALVGRQTYLAREQDAAWHTQLSIGVLGLHLARNVQRWIHKKNRGSTGKDTPRDPKGWSNQVSEGGEPTALYGVSYEKVIGESNLERDRKRFEATLTTGGQAGYYTELHTGFTTRLGHFMSGFWEFQSNPMSATNRRGVGGNQVRDEPSIEWFVFGAARPRWVLYNALLQGQFRKSAVRMGWNDVQHGVIEFETGVSFRFNFPANQTADLTIVYPAGRTAEFAGLNARVHTWASVFVTWTGW